MDEDGKPDFTKTDVSHLCKMRYLVQSAILWQFVALRTHFMSESTARPRPVTAPIEQTQRMLPTSPEMQAENGASAVA